MKRTKISLTEFEAHFFRKITPFKSLKEYYEATVSSFHLRGFNGFLWQTNFKRGEKLKKLIEAEPKSPNIFAASTINAQISKWSEEHGVIPFIVDSFGKIHETEHSYCMGCGLEDYYVVQMCCNGRECGCMGQPVEPIICSPACYNKVIGHDETEDIPVWLTWPRNESLKYYENAAYINEHIKLMVLKTF